MGKHYFIDLKDKDGNIVYPRIHNSISIDENGNIVFPGKVTTNTFQMNTPLTYSLTGGLTGSVNTDLNNDITLTGWLYNCFSITNNKNNYPFHRIAFVGEQTSNFYDASVILLLSQQYNNGSYGIIKVDFRTNNADEGQTATASAVWLVRRGFAVDAIQLGLVNTAGESYVDCFYKSNGTYASLNISVLSNGNRGFLSRRWTLVDSSEKNDTTPSDRGTSYEVFSSITEAGTIKHSQAYTDIIAAVDSSRVSNATTADKANQVYLTTIAPTSDTTYYIPFFTGASNETYYDCHIADVLRYHNKIGTTDVVGVSYLEVGNNIAKGTDKNSRGYYRFYGPNTGYGQITYADSTSNASFIFPAASGTVLTSTYGTITVPISTNVNTSTYLNGNKGINVAINMTNSGNAFTILSRIKSTNGVFLFGVHQDKLGAYYTTDTTISGGGNSPTKTLTLLTESGDMTVPGNIEVNSGIVKKTVSTGNCYVANAKRSDTGTEVQLGIGSGGENHGVYSVSKNQWIVYADNNGCYLNGHATSATSIRVTETNPSTGTWYYPVWTVGKVANSNYNLNANDGLRTYSLQGTTSAVGRTIFELGNSIGKGTAGNKYGELKIWGQSTGVGRIVYHNTSTADTTHTLPGTAGTILNTGTTSYTASYSEGIPCGKIKINGTETTIYTQGSIYNRAAAPTSGTEYYLHFGSTGTEKTAAWVYSVASARLNLLIGTADAQGYAIIRLGNGTASGTAGNVEGRLRLYSANTGYAEIRYLGSTNSRTFYVRDTGGTTYLTGSRGDTVRNFAAGSTWTASDHPNGTVYFKW